MESHQLKKKMVFKFYTQDPNLDEAGAVSSLRQLPTGLKALDRVFSRALFHSAHDLAILSRV